MKIYALLGLFVLLTGAYAQRLGDHALGMGFDWTENAYALQMQGQFSVVSYVDLIGSWGSVHVPLSSHRTESIGFLAHGKNGRSQEWQPFGAFAYVHIGDEYPNPHNLALQGGLQYITGDDNMFRPLVQLNWSEGGSDEPLVLGAEWQWQWSHFYCGVNSVLSMEDMGFGLALGWRLGE